MLPSCAESAAQWFWSMEYLLNIWFVPFIGISQRIQSNLVFVCCASAVSLMNEPLCNFLVNLTFVGTTVKEPCF